MLITHKYFASLTPRNIWNMARSSTQLGDCVNYLLFVRTSVSRLDVPKPMHSVITNLVLLQAIFQRLLLVIETNTLRWPDLRISLISTQIPHRAIIICLCFLMFLFIALHQLYVWLISINCFIYVNFSSLCK